MHTELLASKLAEYVAAAADPLQAGGGGGGLTEAASRAARRVSAPAAAGVAVGRWSAGGGDAAAHMRAEPRRSMEAAALAANLRASQHSVGSELSFMSDGADSFMHEPVGGQVRAAALMHACARLG